MEEVAYRLTDALVKVASNKGAPGPDGQTIEMLLAQWLVVLPGLQADLLQGRYRPGEIRRVVIPKAGGGQRGLGIPVPQGGPLSPLLSNIVLDELDSELDRRGHRFARYADDAKVYVRSERAGQRVMASLTEFIQRRLRLKVNEAKSAVARPEDRHFLGFRLRLDPQTGAVEVLLSERSKRNAMEKVKQLTPRQWGGTLESAILRVSAWLRGW